MHQNPSHPSAILLGSEALNLEIPQNKETVREQYKLQIKQKMKNRLP
jgi:hypothetical protein